MGWRLHLAVVEHAPADLSVAERFVAASIAFAVRDDNGEGWISEERLCRRVGLTPRGLSAALTRLAGRGFELRISHGTDKRGRPVFAHRGRARAFRIPPEWRRPPVDNDDESPHENASFPVDNPEESTHHGATKPEKGRTTVHERSHRRAPHQSRETMSIHPRTQKAIDAICERLDVDPEEGLKILDRMTRAASGPVRDTLAYVRACLDRDPQRWQPTPHPKPTPFPPDCDVCAGSGWDEDHDGRAIPCPRCRAAAGSQS